VPLLVYKQLSYAVGTLGDLLIIKKTNKDYAAGKGSNIYYSDSHLLINQIYVPFNRLQMLFDTQQIINQVMPLLREATYVNTGQMLNMILRRQKSSYIVLLFVAGIVMVGLLMSGIYK
jgi:hypothetical protein